ncbi:MAG TPA: hypothetical protein VMM14_02190 [Acidimicrobiia bacterium]|nr:hypothetical protein [Acidimicrobiia bacterium]
MFLVIGVLIGLNLLTRVGLGEVRELQARGHARKTGQSSVTVKDVFRIALKGIPFLLIPIVIGQLLDMAFNSSLADIFG